MSLPPSTGPLRFIATWSEFPPARSRRRRDDGKGLESVRRPLFSARAGRLSLWLGGAALALLTFIRITRELIEGEVGAMDRAILLAVAKTRTSWLTSAAVDVTALGSITLVVLLSASSSPRGHSLSPSALCLTIAIVAGRYVQHRGARVAIFVAVSAVLIMVGASRVYLGVHYATDVASGISLGAAWALLLAGFFTLLEHRVSP